MMKFFYYIFCSILVTCVSFSLSAQTSISISTVDNDLFITDVINQNGTTTISSITRNTYTGTSASFGFLIKVIYTATNGGRWELQIQDGPIPWQTYYYSTVQSSPKAPSLTFGNWQNGSGGEYSDLDVFSGTGTQNTLSACTTPTAYTVTGTGSYCTGGTGVAVGLSNSESGVTYQLKKNNVDDGTAVAGTGSAISFGTKTVAGTYTVVATRTSGACTATMTGSAVVTVNSLPTATASSNSPICAGTTLNLTGGGVGSGTPPAYAWTSSNGFTSTTQSPTIANATISSTGTYTITVTNVSGCTSTASVAVTVNALPTATASSNSPICAGTTLNLVGGGVGTTYAWTSSNGFTSTAQSPNISSATASMSGTYTIRVTNVSGCTSMATTSVTVNTLPTATASSNAPICAGNALNLTGGGTGTYAWSGPNSFTSTDQSPNISSATASMSGTYTIRVTNVSGCTSMATTSVTVNTLPTATASSNAPICAGNTLNLTGGGTGTYAWTSSNGFTSTAQSPNISSATASMSGTYTIRVTNVSGCTSMATTSVTVNTLPTATASSNAPICAGNALNLTGGGTGTYAWSGPNSFTSTDQSPSLSSATALMAGIYTIRVTNVSGCTSTATTSVTVNAISVGGTVSAAQTICAGTSPANLSLTGNTGTVVKWQKSTDAAFITPADIAGTATTLTGATIGNLTANTYFRAVVKSGVCAEANSSSVLITVNPLPVLNPSSNSPVCSGEQLFLYAKGGNFPSEFPAESTTYTWTGVNTFTANTRNPTISNVSMSANGIYTVSAVSSANCSATGTILVRVKLTPTLVVSNFTNPTPENNPDGTISFTTNLPNSSFSLSYSSTGSPRDVTVSNGAFILNNLVSGIYANFAVTNDGCTGRNNTEVTLLSTPFTLVKSITTGNWEANTTWNIGRVPKAGDVVIIDGGHSVTINSNCTIKDMEVRGQLIYSMVGIIINLGL